MMGRRTSWSKAGSSSPSKPQNLFEDIPIAQALNHLKASDLKTALLLDFGAPSLEIKRLLL